MALERRSDHPYVLRRRWLNRTPDANCQTVKKGIEHPRPAICADVIASLIKVACYLHDQQLRRREPNFLGEGGLRKGMTRARLAAHAGRG